MRSMTGAIPLILNTYTIKSYAERYKVLLNVFRQAVIFWLLPPFLSSFHPFPPVFSINQSRVEGGEEQRQEKKEVRYGGGRGGGA